VTINRMKTKRDREGGPKKTLWY